MLKIFVAVCMCLIPRLGGANYLLARNRIVGGVETTIRNRPYQVSLQYGIQHYCGGTVLDRVSILTAAHCTDVIPWNDDLFVRAGSTTFGTGGFRTKITKIIQHPEYDKVSIENDIAILKISEPLEFSESIQPVNISENVNLAPGTKVVVSGWGVTSDAGTIASPTLREVEVEIINHATCSDAYKGIKTVTSKMLCAGIPQGGKDACQGDSGGPLVLDDGKYQIGLVSWGLGCARPGYPGVYTNILEYWNWIRTHLDDSSNSNITDF